MHKFSLIGIRAHVETQGCGQPATVCEHPASHLVPSVPLETLEDGDMLQGRLVGAQMRWMGLMSFPKPLVTSSERCY